jgi:hypothetical protein
VPLARHRRQEIADHEKIKKIEDENRRHQDEGGPVTPIERRIVEQRQEIFGRVTGHALCSNWATRRQVEAPEQPLGRMAAASARFANFERALPPTGPPPCSS